MADGSQAMFSGPVLKFIGIYSGRINAESDLGIVWKASALNELVQSLCGLTIHSSRSRFAARLNSGVRLLWKITSATYLPTSRSTVAA
ncbi:hypothetical protein FQZ97_1114480 [compost metagenome]